MFVHHRKGKRLNAGLLNSFTSRVILSELLIHVAVASLMFATLVPLIANSYRAQFLTQVDSETNQIVVLLMNQKTPESIDIKAIEGGHIVEATLLSAASATGQTRQDSAFHDSDDLIYYTAVPLTIGEQLYYLQLGYDEAYTVNLIDAVYRYGLYIVLVYILLSTAAMALLGSRLVKPLQRLGQAARRIASGRTSEQLHVPSTITEIRNLSLDLEHMRRELLRQKAEIAEREARISSIMENVIDAFITTDQNRVIQSFNSSAERIFRYAADEVIGKPIDILFAGSVFSNKGHQDHYNLDRPAIETLGRRKDGSSFHMEVTISEVCELEGCLYIAVCRDITRRKHAEWEIKSLKQDLEQRVIKRTRELAEVNRELQHQALHDGLTELPNRALLADRLQQGTRAARRENSALALMILDLDRFKEINDTLGHHCGDLLLQQVAQRMRAVLRDSDTVARLGGDEFAVVIPHIQHEHQATAAAEKIAAAIAAPFTLEGQQFHVGCSIGIAMFPKDGEDHNKLMRYADIAMYVAKRTQNNHAFYDPSQDSHSVDRLAMVGELRQALERNQLSVHYQPTADLVSRRVVGAEALVRWHHENRGTIMPEEFIPLAEQTGLIKALTLCVLDQALAQLRRWHDNGHPLRVAVNLSARNLHDNEIVAQISERMEKWGIDPRDLQLEITESAIMEDPMRAMNILTTLHDKGIKLSIDDFGTGYSSLMYLKQLPVNQIKIDKSFVADMRAKQEDEIIVRSTIDLAHNMGHQVTAEGVDNEPTLDLLAEMGCNLAQGFFISEPLSAEEFDQWLKRSPWSDHLIRCVSSAGLEREGTD